MARRRKDSFEFPFAIISLEKKRWLAVLHCRVVFSCGDSSQPDFFSMLCRLLCLPSLCNRHVLEVCHHGGDKCASNDVRIEPDPHQLRAPRMSPCTRVIGCWASASCLQKGFTKVLADLMYLVQNWGYYINRFAECAGDVDGCDHATAVLPKTRSRVRATVTYQSYMKHTLDRIHELF